MKNFTKLSLLALAIAISFSACTKDNSKATQPSTVNFSTKANGTALKLKDTISPQARIQASKDTISPKKSVVSPQASRDTISPK